MVCKLQLSNPIRVLFGGEQTVYFLFSPPDSMSISFSTVHIGHDGLCELGFHKENASHKFLFIFSSFPSSFRSRASPFLPLSICAKDLSGFHLFDGAFSLFSLFIFSSLGGSNAPNTLLLRSTSHV